MISDFYEFVNAFFFFKVSWWGLEKTFKYIAEMREEANSAFIA